MPVKVLNLELSAGLKPIWGVERYDRLQILVRYYGRPVGWVYLTHLHQPVVSSEQLWWTISEQLDQVLVPVVLGEPLNPESADRGPLTPPVSVVVSIRHRTNQLERCLQALLELEYQNYEIIVVDNTPGRNDIVRQVAQLPVRYVREKQPGLSCARNRGIAEARYDIIAFIEAHTVPDQRWLQAIARAFVEPAVKAVTGFVAPIELETMAQIHSELVSAELGRGLRRRVIKRNALTNLGLSQQNGPADWMSSGRRWYEDRKVVWRNDLTDQELLGANDFGVGTNMAFRRDLFAAVGLFDVGLDIDTQSGSSDIEMFHRLVTQGHTLVYEPAALVWCTHPRDYASLRQAAYDNGRAFGTYLLTCTRKRTVNRRSILRFTIQHWLGGWLFRRLIRPGDIPRHLVALELVGALVSPLNHLARRATAKQVAVGLYPQVSFPPERRKFVVSTFINDE